FDAAAGTAFGATFENEHQNVEMAAGQRDEKDLSQIGMMAGIEGTANVFLGGPLNVLSDKTLRGFAGKNMKKGYQFMKKSFGSKPPVNTTPAFLRKQAGLATDEAIDPSVTGDMFLNRQQGLSEYSPDPFADDKVQLTSNLQDWLTANTKEGDKISTVRQNLKAGLNKGAFKQEEFNWSGINEHLDRLEAQGQSTVGAFRMLKNVEHNTPIPKMVDVSEVSYQDYSLLSKHDVNMAIDGDDIVNSANGSYRERMLVMPSKADTPQPRTNKSKDIVVPQTFGKYRPSHFGSAQNSQLDVNDDMIGHSRVENANMGDSKGKMVLEIQSDYHKEGGQRGYIDKGKFKGDKGILQSTGGVDNHILLKIANDNNIDPRSKNIMPKLWPLLPDDVKSNISANVPEYQPYGKSWDAMGMRLEIMDSINAGDEFIAFPSNASQIDVIEQWGGSYTNEGLVKRATTHRVKELKKMGFEVEQVDMPEYKGLGSVESGSEEAFDNFDHLMDQRGQSIIEDVDENGKNIYELWADPDGHIRGLEQLPEGRGELLKTMDENDYLDFIDTTLNDSKSNAGLQDTMFNVIRLTKEVKDKFLKEGMPAYSLGAFPVAGEAIKQNGESNDKK
ncbi:MAG: hypothetical protein PF495_14480, partial [Spirochaetales bacterium]|nr:hypothetical protein [Spirochaetales bacterium]